MKLNDRIAPFRICNIVVTYNHIIDQILNLPVSLCM